MAIIKCPVIADCVFLTAISTNQLARGQHAIMGISVRGSLSNEKESKHYKLPPGITRNGNEKIYTEYTRKGSDIRIFVPEIVEVDGLEKLKTHCAQRHPRYSFYITKLITRLVSTHKTLGPICIWKKKRTKVDGEIADPVLQLISVAGVSISELSQDQIVGAGARLHNDLCMLKTRIIEVMDANCVGKHF